MAKKIRLDFSKVEERSGYNSRQMPEGLYEAKVNALIQRDAQDGTAMLVYALSPVQAKYATRNFPFYCKLQQNQLWKLRDLFVAAGEVIPKKATQLDPEKIVGARVAIEVGDDTGQYSDRSVVIAVYPLSTLEDLTDDEDEGDEEPEDDELEDDKLEEAADLEEDDEDDEYEDDDEDLDDEEDEDELDEDELDDEDDEELDEEDEEEPEPEPAPKKSKKSAPAKAKAKRAVKRSR